MLRQLGARALSRLAAPQRLKLGLAASAAAAAAAAFAASNSSECKSLPDGLTQQRTKDFNLSEHYHGKSRVRVLRVRREEGKMDTVQEYTVETRLYSPVYTRVFQEEDNSGLVATDTQKNTVYVVAKKSASTTPEGFGIDLARHLLKEYPVLTAVEVDIKEDLWRRHTTPCGKEHEHGFVREAPERATANVRLTREEPTKPRVKSGLAGLTVLKTTQSGFENYLRDKFTLLPETQERCLATEMKLDWTYENVDMDKVDFKEMRAMLRNEFKKGFFGPPVGGVYSPSLQATIYDAGCMVLKAVPAINSISIYTPNIHMIPFHSLKALGQQVGHCK